MKKQTKLLLLMIPIVLLLAGCSNEPLTYDVTGIWDTIVLWIAIVIIKVGQIFNNSLACGLIIVTVIFRLLQIPFYKKQLQSQAEMAKIKPEQDAINKKYAGKKDKESNLKKSQELQAVYQKHNVNPLAGCLPALIQFPLFFIFYDAIQGLLLNGKYVTPPVVANQGLLNLTNGAGMNEMFLGQDLSQPVILLAITSAALTYFNTKLSMAGSDGQLPDAMKSMNIVMPIMVFFMGITLPGGISLYWSAGYVVMLGQVLYFKREKIFNKGDRAKLIKK
ncbi:MAG: YidC/Oxa1 family membrane protein insertase [Mycoplasmatales bacterium]